MTCNWVSCQKYAAPVLRIGLAAVFMWFGVSQLNNPAQWIGLVPDWVQGIVSAETVVLVNGLIEVILATALALGIYVRWVSLYLALHLFVITFHIGFTATGVRDFGLSCATFALALLGDDEFSLKK